MTDGYCSQYVQCADTEHAEPHQRQLLAKLTVRQVPLMATLAPVSIASVLPAGNSICIEEKSFCFVTCCTWPLPWTMPARDQNG